MDEYSGCADALFLVSLPGTVRGCRVIEQCPANQAEHRDGTETSCVQCPGIVIPQVDNAQREPGADQNRQPGILTSPNGTHHQSRRQP